MTVINQMFKMTYDGADISSKVSTASIKNRMGIVYSTGSIEVNVELERFKNITLVLGDTTLAGFVHSIAKKSKGMYTVQLRSHNAKLTTPFSQKEKVVEEVANSSELMVKYAQASGVSIAYSCTTLNFPMGYERTGTMLDAIVNMANVVKAEVFDSGTGVTIRPRKFIHSEGIPVLDDMIFDTVYTTKTIENNGIGAVVIGVPESSSSGNNTKAFIKPSVDGSNGELTIRYMPSGNVVSVVGVSGGAVTKVDLVETYILKTSEILVSTGIVSVISVVVDGVSVGFDFTAGLNKITLMAEQRGRMVVTYVGQVWLGMVNARDLIYEVDITDLQGEVHYIQGELNDSATNREGNDYALFYFPNQMNYVKGFSYTQSGVLTHPLFTADGQLISMDKVTVTSKTLTVAENLTVQVGNGMCFVRPADNVFAVVGVKDSGMDVSYTLVDKNTISVPCGLENLTVTYNVYGSEIFVQSANKYPQKVEMLIGDKTYNLEGFNPDDYTTYPAGLPMQVRIDVATELNLPINSVYGRNFEITKPDGSTGYKKVDKFGFIEFTSTTVGFYKIDYDNYIKGAYSIVTVPGGCDV